MTVLNKELSTNYNSDKVNEYKLMLYSKVEDKDIGLIDYYDALEKLKRKDLTENKDYILVKLNTDELKSLVRSFK